MNLPEYASMSLNKQDSEYAEGPKYAKILNTEKFRIWQSSQYASITQHSEYARIWSNSEYARVTKGSNMPQYG